MNVGKIAQSGASEYSMMGARWFAPFRFRQTDPYELNSGSAGKDRRSIPSSERIARVTSYTEVIVTRTKRCHGLTTGAGANHDPKIDEVQRRNLRSTVPRAGLTETGDQPRQLSSVAQAWTGDCHLDEYHCRNYIWSVPLATLRGELRAGTPSPLLPVVFQLPHSGPELPGCVARWFALLYPAAGRAAGFRRNQREDGLAEIMMRE